MSQDNNALVEIKPQIAPVENIDKKETYRIFDYIKEKPSVAIAICSVAIAAGTALLNLLAYLIDKRYLAFWNVSEDFIQINSIKTIYFIFALILTSVFSIVFQLWLKSVMLKHFRSIRPLMVVDLVLKSLKKVNKHYNKAIAQGNSVLKKYKVNDAEVETKIKEYKEKSKKLEKESKIIRKTTRKEARKYKLILLAIVGTMIVIQTIITLIYLWIADSSTNNVIIPSIILSAILILPFCIFRYLYHKRKKKKEILNSLKNKEYKEVISEDKDDNAGRIRKHFSDNAFLTIFIHVIIVLLTIVCITYSFSFMKCKEKDEFYIFEHDDYEYVYIYENEDCLILEKAEIDECNNAIIINATEQYIIEKTSIHFKFRKFDSVDYIRYK